MCFAVGTTTVTGFASDLYGNYGLRQFHGHGGQHSRRSLTLPANQLVEPTSSAGSTDPAAFTATATDAVDSIASITYAVGQPPSIPAMCFPLAPPP